MFHLGDRRMVLPSTEGRNTGETISWCFLRVGEENTDGALGFIYLQLEVPAGLQMERPQRHPDGLMAI